MLQSIRRYPEDQSRKNHRPPAPSCRYRRNLTGDRCCQGDWGHFIEQGCCTLGGQVGFELSDAGRGLDDELRRGFCGFTLFVQL